MDSTFFNISYRRDYISKNYIWKNKKFIEEKFKEYNFNPQAFTIIDSSDLIQNKNSLTEKSKFKFSFKKYHIKN